MPNFEQNAFAVSPPLPIPEAEFLNVLGCQIVCSCLIAPKFPGQALLKPIQFHRQPSKRTIKIQNVSPSVCWRRNLNPANRPARRACQSCFSSFVCRRRRPRALPIGFTSTGYGPDCERQAANDARRDRFKGTPLPASGEREFSPTQFMPAASPSPPSVGPAWSEDWGVAIKLGLHNCQELGGLLPLLHRRRGLGERGPFSSASLIQSPGDVACNCVVLALRSAHAFEKP